MRPQVAANDWLTYCTKPCVGSGAVKKSKLSRKVAPEYCAERRYVALATVLSVASMASKVMTVDN